MIQKVQTALNFNKKKILNLIKHRFNRRAKQDRTRLSSCGAKKEKSPNPSSWCDIFNDFGRNTWLRPKKLLFLDTCLVLFTMKGPRDPVLAV
jgi:hypothetical protein